MTSDLVLKRSDRELIACRPPSGATVSEFSADHRVLDMKHSNEAGPYNPDRIRYIVEILDTLIDPSVEWVDVMKGAQMGLTEAAINFLLYIVCEDPSPTLVVYPSLKIGKKILRRRLDLAVQLCLPAKARHESTLISEMEMHFDQMVLQVVGANNAEDLASWPIRRVILDETDKFTLFAGDEADPISLAYERTKSYAWNRMIFAISTPTNQHRFIYKSFMKSDQRRYHVPCPNCNEHQVLVWDQVKYPDDVRDPEAYKENRGIATYECLYCKERIPQSHRDRMVAKGVWCPKGSEVNQFGELEHPKDYRPARHRGFHATSLMSPFVTFDDLVAKYLDAEGDIGPMMSFVNSDLGNAWMETELEVDEDLLRDREWGHERGTVPDEAIAVTGGVDVQEGHFWYVIRAWGYSQQNWLVEAGRLESWEDVEEFVVNGVWSTADGSRHFQAMKVAIDCRYDWMKVYAFCKKNQLTCVPVRGVDTLQAGVPCSPSPVEKQLPGFAAPVKLQSWNVNTDLFKRQLVFRMDAQPGEVGAFWVHNDIDDRYVEQMTNEELVPERDAKGNVKMVWIELGPNHLWDCEVYASAAAWIGNVYLMKDPNARTGASFDGKPPKKATEEEGPTRPIPKPQEVAPAPRRKRRIQSRRQRPRGDFFDRRKDRRRR